MHQSTECSKQCWVPWAHCLRLSGGTLQTNTNFTILPADNIKAAVVPNTIGPNQKTGALLQDQAYSRLAKDPTQTVKRKNILFLKKSTLAEKVRKRLIPRVQNSPTFVKRKSLLGLMSRKNTTASVESWPHTTSRVLACHQRRSPAFHVLWGPTSVWGLRIYKLWVWPRVHNSNTGHKK